MAVPAPSNCPNHDLKPLKSETHVVAFQCHACHSGPHQFVTQCTKCRFKACRICTNKLQDAARRAGTQ